MGKKASKNLLLCSLGRHGTSRSVQNAQNRRVGHAISFEDYARSVKPLYFPLALVRV
jgi:hypothetical protein